MSNPLYQNRGKPQSHDEELKWPPLSRKGSVAGVPGPVPQRLKTVPDPLRGKGGGEPYSEWFFLSIITKQNNDSKHVLTFQLKKLFKKNLLATSHL